MRLKLLSWVGATVMLVLDGAVLATGSATLRVQLLADAGWIRTPSLVALGNQHLYVFDDVTNRLVVLDEAGKLVRTIGAIGSNPGEFYHPAGLVLTDDSIIVYDKGNLRVEIFSLTGQFKSQFPVGLDVHTGIAVDSQGRVYVNDPHSGRLITSYERDGHKRTSFGDLTSVSSLYASGDLSRDYVLKWQANRAWLAVDSEDYVFAAFVIAPVIRKYAPDGKLLFEKSFSGPEARSLRDIFWHEKPGTRLLSSPIDGTQVDFITKAISYDREARRLYVLAGLDGIYEFDPDGRQQRFVRIEGKRGQLFRMDVKRSRVVMGTIFSPGIYTGRVPEPAGSK